MARDAKSLIYEQGCPLTCGWNSCFVNAHGLVVMQKMSLRFSRILEVTSAAVQILSYLGLPIATLVGIAAGVVARFKDFDILTTALIILFVIAAVLHIIISLIYIFDRLMDRRRQIEQENAGIHYRFAPMRAMLNRDPNNESAEYQLRVQMLNSSEYPVRYLIVSSKCIIDERVSPCRASFLWVVQW